MNKGFIEFHIIPVKSWLPNESSESSGIYQNTSILCSSRFEELIDFIALQLSSGKKHTFSQNMNCNVQLSYKYNESSTCVIASLMFGVITRLQTRI